MEERGEDTAASPRAGSRRPLLLLVLLLALVPAWVLVTRALAKPPLVLVVVVGVDYLIVSLLRSPMWRGTLIALLVIPPIGLVAWWNLVLLRDLSGLMQQLR